MQSSVRTARRVWRSPISRRLALLIAIVSLASCERKTERPEVTLATAASLRVALPELIAAFAQDHARPIITPVYGASGDLKKRLLDGAPIDAVLFAAPEPVDQLIAAGRVDASTRRVIAHNRLVLIGPKGGPKLRWQSLDALPEGAKIAIGNPDSVPAGAYAKKALVALGKWDALQGRLVYAADVAAALAYARRGEVAAAVVYTTEIQGIADVVVLDDAGSFAPRADVVVAVVKDAARAEPARAFLAFLATPAAQAILKAHGFEIGE